MIQRSNDTKHGPGAAHIRYGMFGARGPLLAPEDSGGSGGSTGSTTGDATGNTTTTTTDQTQQAAGGGQPKMLTMTQADFDRQIQERLDRDRKARGGQQSQQRQETRQSEGTGQTQQQANGATSVDAMFQLEMNDAIEAIEEKLGVKLPATAKKRIRTVGSVERPGDKEAYVTGWVNDLGLGKKTDNTQNTNQSTGQQTQQQNGQQTNNGFSSDKGGANGGETRDFEQLSLERPLELTQDDIQRMHLKHGEEKANGMIRDRVNAYLRNIKLVADPRRLEQMRRAKQ
jgi:hypothetical protein